MIFFSFSDDQQLSLDKMDVSTGLKYHNIENNPCFITCTGRDMKEFNFSHIALESAIKIDIIFSIIFVILESI